MQWPTLISPWYVVSYFTDGQEWYYRETDTTTRYTTDPREAFVFTHLHPAARIATAEQKNVRVIFTREEAVQFIPEITNETNWPSGSGQETTRRNF